MLAKLLSVLMRREADPVEPDAGEPGAIATETPALSSMVSLQPPAASNDDVLAELNADVERELRVWGYLR